MLNRQASTQKGRGIVGTWLLLAFLVLLSGCGGSDEATPTATPVAAEPTPAAAETEIDEPTSTETTAAQAISDPILNLDKGWTKLDPGGETRCAHNTDFAFWVRPGQVNKLLIYFQGGGGCWNGDTCLRGSGFYADSVDARDSPAGRGGILDLDNPENPFAGYHMVYVPSCTGDIYLGSNIQDYVTSAGAELEIYHYGFNNLNAAVDWAFANVLAPDSVFVTGCSAGSIGSIRAAPHLMHHYGEAPVTQLGDSLGFLFNQPTAIDSIYGHHDTLPDWIPAFADFDRNGFTMAEFYNAVADFYPQHTLAQYNTEADSVQVRYHLAGGRSAASFPDALAGAISAIHAESDNFRSYTAEGDVHCIMPGGLFYSREVNGVRFRDWVADLAAGRDVVNVQCDTCQVNFGAEPAGN